jgi:peptidyl-prolyl cis-trans isomerase D
VFEPAGADAGSIPEETQTAFSRGIADDLLDQLVARLQGEYEVEVNRSLIEQALAF